MVLTHNCQSTKHLCNDNPKLKLLVSNDIPQIRLYPGYNLIYPELVHQTAEYYPSEYSLCNHEL